MELNYNEQEMYESFVKQWRLKNKTPSQEAEYLARIYVKAEEGEEKIKLINILKFRGSDYDTITRSTFFFNIFEEAVGEEFYELWAKDKITYENMKKEVKKIIEDSKTPTP